MFAYVVRRLFATIVVMAVVAFVVFLLLYLTPGDPAAILAGDAATSEDIRKIREKLGLDDPFLERFGQWLWRLLHGDLGISIFTNLPVTHLIAQRIEPTLSLSTVPIFTRAGLVPRHVDLRPFVLMSPQGVTITPGDRLFIYSDGVELAFGDGENLDTARWRQELAQRAKLPTDQLMREFSEHVDRFSPDPARKKDDLTLIVLDIAA